MKKEPQIRLYFLRPAPLKSRKALKKFITVIFQKEKIPLETLNIIFCSDAFLLNLNKRFLSHDFYTDILSFRLSEERQPLQAELYISIDRVAANAQSLGNFVQEELHRVIFHGVLHFCGYGDKSGIQIAEIRARENHYLKQYALF